MSTKRIRVNNHEAKRKERARRKANGEVHLSAMVPAPALAALDRLRDQLGFKSRDLALEHILTHMITTNERP